MNNKPCCTRCTSIETNEKFGNPKYCLSELDCECHSEPQTWEEELKRQCEIRGLPFLEIKYLVDEVLSSHKQTLKQRVGALKKEWKWNINAGYLGADFRTCNQCEHLENDPETPHSCEVTNQHVSDIEQIIDSLT